MIRMPERRTVVVQGLGFVGAAMAVAVAMAADADGSPLFEVAGLDLPTVEGRRRADELGRGNFPFRTTDASLAKAARDCVDRGNLTAAVNSAAISRAGVVIVDIHFDVEEKNGRARVDFASFRRALRTIGDLAAPGTLVLVETTVPPGTCAKVAAPVLAEALRARSLPSDALLLAHSYERVMPGADYLASIRNFWRVYAGHTPEAARACRDFLEKIINTSAYPLTELETTTASEFAKVLENSYRAANIAFVEEWARLAERIGVDMFSVIEAIRVRPTHANLRRPGFGVGGYCLTKDPLLGAVAARQLYGYDDLAFPFSEQAIVINRRMPHETVRLVRSALGGSLAGRRLLLLGVAYREDVGDTRYSPSEIFLKAAEGEGAVVVAHDPLVESWEETGHPVARDLPSPNGFDALIFAVPHSEYRKLDVRDWLADKRPLVFDANDVLGREQRGALRAAGVRVGVIGSGLDGE